MCACARFRRGFAVGFVALLAAALPGCNVDVPFDPNNLLGDLTGALQGIGNDIEDALNDPLDAKPFPVLIGGDSQRVFYATNLTQIRLNFPGPTNDVVVPGIFGPSNVYKLEGKQRDLIRPLTPTAATVGLTTLTTDGRFVAYISIADLDAAPRTRLMATDLQQLEERVVFDPGPGGQDGPSAATLELSLDGGRLAFVIMDFDADVDRLRVEDLTGLEPAREIEGDEFFNVTVRGNRLVYGARAADGSMQVVLRDLASDAETIVAAAVPGDAFPPIKLTNNAIVWAETDSTGVSRIMTYDLAARTTRVWADAVPGTLTGASDQFFLTEEHISRLPDAPDRLAVVRYAADGTRKELAQFAADGFAGQSRIVGDRAVWVNPDRRIVIQPLAGGERKIFRPF